jgi:hypothetical protein
LAIPRSLLEREAIFVSLLGSPSCGKSYFLAALATTLRRDLPSFFRLDFSDADSVSNRTLTEYEERLFMNHEPDKHVFLGDLIPKTQLGGFHYNTVKYGSQEISYPNPFPFLIEPASGHPNFGKNGGLRRIICLYDNAGEHFLPGNDQPSAPGTRHMAESRYLMFLFDPTQDPRWHAAVKARGFELPRTNQYGRQESILREAAARIGRLLGYADGQKHDRPLIVILNKVDVWRPLLPDADWRLPIYPTRDGFRALHVGKIRECSMKLRELLLQHLPELVYAAESFANQVWYVPASSLGNPPIKHENGQYCILPTEIEPWWVTIPFLLGMALANKGLVPTAGAGSVAGANQ